MMFNNLKKYLLDPPPSVPPGLPQLRARLLSLLALGFLVVDILLTIRGELSGGASYHVYILAVLVLIVYIISRTKYTYWGGLAWIVWITFILQYLFIDAAQTSPERVPQGIGFLSLPIFLALLFLSAKSTVAIAVLNFLSFGIFLQVENIPIDPVILPLVSTFFFSIIAVITAFILEKDRQNLLVLNKQLVDAYEATLEGWAKALELREKETAGHSRRVVELTLKVALHFQIPEESLAHIRRGALLHDIGKLAIPNVILLKNGSPTEDEWEVIRTHPDRALEMLGDISFLKPALKIPYGHHERWDGSGYPQGLKGEEIPLEARVFAVVDVWDALLSDRPYRAGWPKEKVLTYLQDNSGVLFDPQIVDIFLKMVQK